MMWSLIKLRRWRVVMAALLLAPGAPLCAQQVPLQVQPVRFQVRAWSDGVASATLALGSAVPSLLGDRLPMASCAPCDPSQLWGIDRGSVGAVRSGPEMASNVALMATVGGSALLVAVTRRGEPRALDAVLEDAAVMVQAAALDGFITQWLKVAVHRARPERYTPQGSQFTAVEDSRSFPSGHASFAFAAAAAAASILHRRGELHRHKVETILLFAGAAVTSALRVAARQHFPTDVLAGAVLGTAIGWTVPMLHPVH